MHPRSLRQMQEIIDKYRERNPYRCKGCDMALRDDMSYCEDCAEPNCKTCGDVGLVYWDAEIIEDGRPWRVQASAPCPICQDNQPDQGEGE
jgi:rubrerythrin